MATLSAGGLRKSFRGGRGVQEVSLEVAEGEVVGLLGSNGAGKTTTFRLLTGELTPDAGIVRLDGLDVSRWPLRKRVRVGGLGYLPQEPSIFSGLTVQDNLLAILYAHRCEPTRRRERCLEMLERFRIDGLKHTLAQNLSGGQKRRLEFARCLLCSPRVILLDEPFNGVDPIAVEDIQQIIRALRATGLSILISDHHVVETLMLVDRAYVIHNGHVLFAGTPAELVANPQVRCHYLGEGLRLPANLPGSWAA